MVLDLHYLSSKKNFLLITIFISAFFFPYSQSIYAQGELFWTTEELGVFSADLDGGNVTGIYNPGDTLENHGYGIIPDTVAQKIYWTDLYQQKIFRANYDGSERETLLDNASGLGFPWDLAIDFIAEKIYILDSEYFNGNEIENAILRIDLDGGNQEVLALEGDLVLGNLNPTAIQLDLQANYLYISDIGDGIFRYDLNRLSGELSNKTSIVPNTSMPMFAVLDFAVDIPAGKLYFTNDRSGNAGIFSVNKDGSGPIRKIVDDGLSCYGISLDIPNRHIYYSRWISGDPIQIKRVNFDGSDDTFLAQTGSLGYRLATLNEPIQRISLPSVIFKIVDADTDIEVVTLMDGERYLLTSLPENFNIVAIVEGEFDTERVVMELTGPVSNTRTERKAPYAVFGDSNGNYSGRATKAGMYEISATPFYMDGTSMQGTPITVAFEIFDCAISGPTANAGPEKTLDCTSGEVMLMGSVAGTDFGFRWEGPDGFTTSSTLMPTVSEPGIYTLVAFDENMCSSVDQVLVKPCPEDCTPEILRFVLVNSDTDQDIRPLMNNTNIDLSMVGRKLNIRAEVLCEDKTESVRLELTGAQTRTRTENQDPYALAGDSNGNYSNQNFGPGSYTLTATPYTENATGGDAGIPLTINFTVSNGPPAQQSQFGDPSLNPDYELSVYPVPATEALTIDMKFFDEGQYQAEIFDVAGRAIMSQTLTYDDLTGKRFSVNTANLSQGVYMLRVSGQNYLDWRKISITK